MAHRIGIMQPYFLPYIGYWQLIKACDSFVIYDAIQYTKKGWVNRNRLLLNGAETLFSLPLKKDSDYKDIRDRVLAEDFDRSKLLRQFKEAYRKAPCFDNAFPVLEDIIMCPETNLFAYIFSSIKKIAAYLDITTPLIVSSTLAIDNTLKGQDKVIAICKAMGAAAYLNPVGGLDLYDRAAFKENGLNLGFLKTGTLSYPQWGNDFIPHLSIADVMMFNPVPRIKEFLNMWDPA